MLYSTQSTGWQAGRRSRTPLPLPPAGPVSSAAAHPAISMSARDRQREFEGLLEPLLPAAFGLALQLVRHRDDAEDLVQEAAVRAFRFFDSFTPGTNFKAWFFKILTNGYFQRYRKRQREPEIAPIEDVPDLYLYSATAAAGLHAQSADPAALVLGPTGLAYDQQADVLYVASTADNAIFAVANAGKATFPVTKGKRVFADPHLRGPLALVLAPNGDLLTANGDAVNADPTHPSEIVEFTKQGQFVKQLNVDPAQGGSFGLAVNVNGGTAILAAVDDNTATLTIWKISLGQ